MRFFAGVIVGIVVGRPVVSVARKRLGPPAYNKFIMTLEGVSLRLQSYINSQDLENNR